MRISETKPRHRSPARRACPCARKTAAAACRRFKSCCHPTRERGHDICFAMSVVMYQSGLDAHQRNAQNHVRLFMQPRRACKHRTLCTCKCKCTRVQMQLRFAGMHKTVQCLKNVSCQWLVCTTTQLEVTKLTSSVSPHPASNRHSTSCKCSLKAQNKSYTYHIIHIQYASWQKVMSKCALQLKKKPVTSAQNYCQHHFSCLKANPPERKHGMPNKIGQGAKKCTLQLQKTTTTVAQHISKPLHSCLKACLQEWKHGMPIKRACVHKLLKAQSGR